MGFSRYTARRLGNAFSNVYIEGAEDARDHLADAPHLILANHSTWWDALVALWVSERVLGIDAYALMNAENLAKYPFFSRVGAFGVDIRDPKDGARGIFHAVRLLDRPGRAVWVFPQGEERSPFEPLVLVAGAAQIARLAKRTRLLPVTLRYVMGPTDKPDLYIAMGPSVAPAESVKDGIAQQTSLLEAGLARIDHVLATRDLGRFIPVIARRPESPWGAWLLARIFPLEG